MSTTARAAVDCDCYRAARHAGLRITSLEGVDGLVFTGGVGETAAPVRAGIVEHLNWMDVVVETGFNEAGESEISPPAAACPVWTVKANEELAIAHHLRHLLKG